MLAAVYHGPEDVRVEERPTPEIGPHEVLLKVSSAGICGTDLRILYGNHRQYPSGTVRVPGHEIVGVIEELGREVTNLTEGRRVFVAPNVGCGQCGQCVRGHNHLCPNFEAFGITRDGGFAEYMLIPARAILQGNVIPIEESLDPAVAALAEPLACVLRGQDPLDIRSGDTVLIVGAGPIGILHLLLARLSGASRVIVSQRTTERLAQAKKFGADVAVNPVQESLAKVVAEESNGRGADVVIVAAASKEAQEESLQLAASNGRINFFGGLPKDRSAITIDANLVHYKELLVTGTTGCSTADCRRAVSILESERIDVDELISSRFPLNRALEAFEAAADRRSLKIALQP
jgi:L-iditol 2-dehydrogenase